MTSCIPTTLPAELQYHLNPQASRSNEVLPWIAQLETVNVNISHQNPRRPINRLNIISLTSHIQLPGRCSNVMITDYYHKTLQTLNPFTTNNIHKYRWHKEGRTTPMRWMDSVEEDLQKRGFNNWKTKAENRMEQRSVVGDVKVKQAAAPV